METILSMEIFENIYTDLIDFASSGTTEYIELDTDDFVFDNNWIFIIATKIPALSNVIIDKPIFLDYNMRSKRSLSKEYIEGYDVTCLLKNDEDDSLLVKFKINVGKGEKSNNIYIKADYEVSYITTETEYFVSLYNQQKNFMRLIKMALYK